MHADNNRANITLTKPLNNLEAIDALSEYLICGIITKLQLIGQQLMELLFSRAQHPSSFIARDLALQMNASLLYSHRFKISNSLIFSIVVLISVRNNFSCSSSFSSSHLLNVLYP